MRVIGTAGHVDHGKSTLIKALTGIDPDRLAEEKARQMTIDLGFAFMRLNDQMVGIVDVPGHRDFIENMLAGVGGIDAVLLVIAADEGIMPQTREHIAILELLAVENAVVVLTKIDAVNDPDWLDLIEADIRTSLSKTQLIPAGFVRTSSHTGQGLDELVATLSDLLEKLPLRTSTRIPRLPIDRVFSVNGFGTVITGTLRDGALDVETEVTIQPTGLTARIRSIQSYHQPVDAALAGSRVAINLGGVDKLEIERGHVVTLSGALTPTRLVDVYYRHLSDASRPLKHQAMVKVYSGTAEYTARLRLLFDEQVLPGQAAWAQLQFDQPAVLADRDRFVIRIPSPAETIGGGTVANAHPTRRWRRHDPQLHERLEQSLKEGPAEKLARAAISDTPIKREQLRVKTGFMESEFSRALDEAVVDGRILLLSEGVLNADRAASLLEQIRSYLRQYHEQYPLRMGMPREELRSRVRLKVVTLAELAERAPDIIMDRAVVRLSSHRIRFTPEQQERITGLLATLRQQPFTPPSVSEILLEITPDELRALQDLGDVVTIQPEVLLEKSAYTRLIEIVKEMFDTHETITAAILRDRLITSRKFAIAYLEHLDSAGITKRVGDARVKGRFPG